MLTEPLIGFCRTGYVWGACIERNLATLLDPFVSTCVTSSMAAACDKCTAVQHMLNGEVDVISLTAAGDLDTIS